MDIVCIVEAEDAAVVWLEPMGKEEGEVLASYLSIRIDPDFFAKNSDAAGTAKAGFVVGIFAQASVAGH